jgi:hypothetical protein
MKKRLLLFAFIICNAVNAQLPTNVPLNGLVAFYPCSGNGNDAGPNGLNGTVNGAVATNDRFLSANNAMYFNNNYVEIPSNTLMNTGTGLTVSAWVSLTSPNLDQKVIGRTNTAFNSGFVLGIQNFQIYPEVWDNAGVHYTFSAGALSTGGWDQIVMTWSSGGYFVAYVNGIAVDSIPASANPIGANSEPLVIGVSPWSLSPSFLAVYGVLDDLGMWNRPLSAAEVLALYQSMPQGIHSVNAAPPFSVYPNPVNETITVRSKKGSPVSYRILDGLGREIRNGVLNSLQENIDIHVLSPGIYYLQAGNSGPVTKIVKL